MKNLNSRKHFVVLLFCTISVFLIASFFSGCYTANDHFEYKSEYGMSAADVKGLQFTIKSKPLVSSSTLKYYAFDYSTSYSKDVSNGTGTFQRSGTTEKKFIEIDAETPGICVYFYNDEISIDFGDGIIVPFTKGHIGNSSPFDLGGSEGYTNVKEFTSNGIKYQTNQPGDFYLKAVSTYINNNENIESTKRAKGKTLK